MAHIPNTGLYALAEYIRDHTSHVAIGVSDTAPTDIDTQLGLETYRAAPTQLSLSGNEVRMRVLLPNSNLPPTIKEIGWFLDGSGNPNSGELLAREIVDITPGGDDYNILIRMTVGRV